MKWTTDKEKNISKATLDQIIEEVKALTPDEQRQLREMLDKEVRTAELRRIQEEIRSFNHE